MVSTRVSETEIPRENNPELIEMNTIQVEEREVTGPYAIEDPEQNAHYLNQQTQWFILM